MATAKKKPAAKKTAKLTEYERKRDFGKTPEPGVGAEVAAAPETRPPWAKKGELAYLIHEHHARALHFDLRLEWEGVLMSWAVPKGPSLDSKDKRLAVHVEDHPLEYGTFEGDIPAGEYGAGHVIIWDCGTWEPIQDPAVTLPKGELKFTLRGQKLEGAWMLVRMKPRPGEKRENWLLFKERDAKAKPGFDTLAELPGSVSDKCMPERKESGGGARAGAKSSGAGSSGAGEPGAASARTVTSAPPAVDAAELPGSRKAAMPREISAMLATLSDATPEGERWVHEVKYDGYRAVTFLDKGVVRMTSRNGLDWTDRFGAVPKALAGLPARSTVLDGEVVVLDRDGVSSFGALQQALSARDAGALTYEIFDLLYLDGRDLRKTPLLERKRALAALLHADPHPGPLRYSDHVEGHGEAFNARACEFALEGVVSKLADSPYIAGRSRSWIKSKCAHRQEFVVGGYTEGAGARSRFGALLVGYYAEGELRYAGRVGTGYDDATIDELLKGLTSIERRTPPFADPPIGPVAKRTHWVTPVLVAEVAFAEWTRDGILRQPVYKGLREDKAAADVVREDMAGGEAGSAGQPGAGEGSGAPSEPAKADPPSPGGHSDRPTSLHSVKITHPGRKLFTGSGLTKLDLGRYYEAVWDRMEPHVTGRPLTLMRCPHGMAEECFYQRHVGEPFPKHVRSVPIPGMSDPEGYIVIDDLTGLLELVQLGALEFHGWGCRADEPDRPDRLIWDLDPDEGLDFADVAAAAQLVRGRLKKLGLTAFLDATGGKGLHVVTPVEPDTDWGPMRDFAKALAQDVANRAPDKFTTNMRKVKRAGGIFLDYVRNTKSSSAIVPYSTRSRDGAPVCVPLTWAELGTLKEAPRFTVVDVLERIEKRDPWAGYEKARAAVTRKARSALGLED